MCTVAGAMMGATALSAGVSAYGQLKQASAAATMSQYQANAATIQAQLVKNYTAANITYTQDAAARAGQILSKKYSQLEGSQVAQAGAHGIGSSGTAADIYADTKMKREWDEAALHYNADVKAWEMTNQMNEQVWGLDVEAGQDRLAAKYDLQAGKIGAVTSLLSGASQVAQQGFLTGGGGGGSSFPSSTGANFSGAVSNSIGGF